MQLTIGWLYPELMNIYGDRGNIICLSKRCEDRDIDVKINHLNLGFSKKNLEESDLIIMGGAQDKQQQTVAKDLFSHKETIATLINKGTPGLYICGAYQFLGNYYKEANGNIIKGLEIFDLYTENPGEKAKRLIGDIAINSQFGTLIGFENHGGRTYISKKYKPLGEVMSGFGNNGNDKTEGILYKNSIGSYLHGPILPKNPLLSDFLIIKALEIKYNKHIVLKPLDDSLSEKARKVIAKRLSVAI